MPPSDSCGALGWAAPRRSLGAFSAMTAFLRCSGVSDASSLKPVSSSGFRIAQSLLEIAEVAADLGRIGAQERRRRGRDVPVVDDEIQRQMVPLDAPAPAAGVVGRAEDGEVITFGIANGGIGAGFLQLAQNRFEAHDRLGLFISQMAQPAFQQLVRGAAGRLVHELDLQSLTLRLGDEMPIQPRRIIEADRGRRR